MGDLDEFPLRVRTFLRAYPWRPIEPVPWTLPAKPLAECRLALVSSAGLVLRGQTPFDGSIRGGDVGFREIPSDADVSRLVDTHRSDSYDHAGVRADPNLAFPIDRVRELQGEGAIGSSSAVHLSFMGSITAPGRLVRESAPRMAQTLVRAGADVALLIPI